MGKWMKNMKKILFYSAAGLCGIVVVPTLGLIAAVFTLCGVVCPIAGVVKLAGHLLHFDDSALPGCSVSYLLSE